MTIALLASVSLFALVVTSRPVLSSDFAPASSTLQTGVQAAFGIHPGKDDLKSDAARFHFQKPKQQIEYLSELGTENVVAIASFETSPDVQPLFNVLLGATADSQDAIDSSDEHDDAQAEDKPASEREQQEAPADEPPSAPLAVLVFSCRQRLHGNYSHGSGGVLGPRRIRVRQPRNIFRVEVGFYFRRIAFSMLKRGLLRGTSCTWETNPSISMLYRIWSRNGMTLTRNTRMRLI
ncbi:hypothetical protein OG21DRAFT_153200 [Imleria badia]|nr:hypothetical protein OG21DRAFT_153200 [Imleria badia]